MNNGLGALRTDPDDEFLEVSSLSREVMCERLSVSGAPPVPPKYHQKVRHQAVRVDTYRHEISGGQIQNGTC
jgi:hypothetical protein